MCFVRTPLWKKLISQPNNLQPLVRWVVGTGDRKFWIDKWPDEVVHVPQPVDTSLTIAHGLQIINELWDFIPLHLHDQIREVSVGNLSLGP